MARMPDYAGLRAWIYVPAQVIEDGDHEGHEMAETYVGVYDGQEAGMDTDGGRWQTVCERHSWVVSHRSLATARGHAPYPADWCEKCNGQEPEDDWEVTNDTHS